MVFESDPDIVFRAPSEEGQDMQVRGGTVEKLVEKLTFHKMPSTDYTMAFLVTYRSFTTPETLFKLLTNRYKISATAEMNDVQRKLYHAKKIVPVRLR
jgi:son of sevenless-like protein